MAKKDNSDSKENRASSFLSSLSKKSDREITLTEYFRRQTKKTYGGLFKDLEISRGQFFTLYLLLLSFASVLAIDLFLSFEAGTITTAPSGGTLTVQSEGISASFFIVIGIFIGFLYGGFMVDRIRGRRYQKLYFLLFISIIITVSHILFFRRTGALLPGILFLVNSFIAGLLFMFFITFFIDFTTILERGRVFSYLMIILAFSIVFIIILVSNEILMMLPVLIICLSLYYFYKNREKEEPYKPIEREVSKKEINYNIIKYLFIICFFSLTIGLFIPTADVENLGTSEWTEYQVLGAVFIAIFASLITVIAVGMIFDFFGRKAAISAIILAISIVNFIRLFNVEVQYFDLAIILAAFLANFMAVPLLMSDITQRKNLGRILGLAFTLNLFCIGLGLVSEYYIIQIFLEEYTSEIFLIGVVNFASIIALFFLVNTKETVSSKEKNWLDYLIHLYVIHESGILIYEHSFIEEELAEADLISGGFIGLITILQEITKEQQRLRTIDHGGKRIMFGFDSKKNFVFALIITEELLILRNKLAYFISEIEEKYSIDLKEFSGINVELWKNRIVPLIDKYFKRKYFDLVPEIVSMDS